MFTRKLRRAIFCILFFGEILFAQSDIWISAYYPGWEQGWNNTGYLKAEDIDYSAITHLIHFSLIPNTDGTYDSLSNGMYGVNAASAVQATHAAEKKILICVGGANTAAGFRGATSGTHRTVFVNNLVGFITRYGYDGIDIDWEPLEQTDSAQFVLFINELTSTLNSISPRLLLTAAVGSMPAMYAQVQSSFDQINIMTYDMSGPWDGWVTWHNSPLYNGNNRFPGTNGLLPGVHGLVETFTAAGISPAKLGIGIGFYGYEWRGGSGTPTGGVTAPRQGWSTAPEWTARNYYEIMDSFYQPTYARWDSIALVPYLSIDNASSANDRFITYDDERSIGHKIGFARTHGLGGAIIWELGGGYRANQPAGDKDQLLQAVKNAAQLSMNQPTARYPFPQHPPYASGSVKSNTLSQSAMDGAVRSFYDQWKARYLVAGCDSGQYYVYYNYESGETPVEAICVSEGQGYGMLITALMAGYDPNARHFFDGLYRYYRAHPSSINNRLMAWRQLTGCLVQSGDDDAATDGDLDVAYALLLADKQWGSNGEINYLQEAYILIDAVLEDEINPDRISVKLGDWADLSDPAYYNATRSSDFMMDHFRSFATLTGDTIWNRVLDNCYNYIAAIQTNNSPVTGLLPDFIKNLQTTPAPAQAHFLESAYDGHYYYNACRDPWRIATDYLISGDTRAKAAVQKINTWIKTATGGNPSNLRSGYYLNGNVIHNDYVDLPFLAPLMVGAMVDTSNREWLNALWSTVTGMSINADGYYGNSIKMICMIVASGNWWNPAEDRMISFSGYQWKVKNSGGELVGPGPNVFSDALSSVWVDDLDRLHMKITHREGAWQCSEVVLNQSPGYGRYVFHVLGKVGALDKNAVLGLFTWDDDTAQYNREIDIEFARWGDAEDPTNAQFVAQPFYTPGNLVRWTIPGTMDTSTHSFNWKADSIGFVSAGGDRSFPPYSVVNASWTYTGPNIPSPGNENARINLWLYQGNAPSDTQEIEVIISKFEFNPLPPPPQTPVLLSPEQSGTVTYLPAVFRWSSSLLADTYHLQLSTSSSFTTCLVNDSSLTDTSYSVSGLTHGTTYYWRLRAKNSGGASAWSDVATFTFSSRSKWRIVSLPFVGPDPRVITVFPAAISPAFAFTQTGYQQKDTLLQGTGYWLKFSTDTSAFFEGDTIVTDTIEVMQGWNLIGSISLPINAVLITSDPPGIIEGNFFGYENGYFSSPIIVPGRGYWIKVNAAGSLFLTSISRFNNR